jgi:hypothetical protein
MRAAGFRLLALGLMAVGFLKPNAESPKSKAI